MKKNISIGLLYGFLAGIIDLIPMIIQKLSWDANLSALSLWIVSGFFIATIDIKILPILKGLLISFLVFLPCSFIIGWQNPVSLLPIIGMTFVLGGTLGFFINQTILKNI